MGYTNFTTVQVMSRPGRCSPKKHPAKVYLTSSPTSMRFVTGDVSPVTFSRQNNLVSGLAVITKKNSLLFMI